MIGLYEILSATKGRLIQKGPMSSFPGISTDSRTVKRGELFIPIAGKNFDGHEFLLPSMKKGASALSSKPFKPLKKRTAILVKDTLRAFHDIASYHRSKFNIPFIGITGSSGKTTTKDMMASILSLAGCTLKTEENFNNEIGVPKTLLRLNKKHRFAVVEMAMQGLGEIACLSRIVSPNIAIIVNIGKAHMEHLRSEKNIATAKSEILKFQKKNDVAILPADDRYFGFLKSRAQGKVISFGIDKPADVRATNIMFQSGSSSFTVSSKGVRIDIVLPLPGKHNVYDAIAAAAAAIALGIRPGLIKTGLESSKLSSKRLNTLLVKGIRIIDDTYNANPDSVAASLNILENYPGRRIAVLGDMFELGKIAIKSHRDVGRLAAELSIDTLIAVGKLSKHIAKTAKEHGLLCAYHAASNRQVVKILKKMIRPDDTILVKGSRGMRMEEIVEALKKLV